MNNYVVKSIWKYKHSMLLLFKHYKIKDCTVLLLGLLLTLYNYIPFPEGWGYIGLVGLLGASLQLRPSSGCSV